MGVPYAEVIGDPIAHSKSPLIHKFWLHKLGIEGDYRATRASAGELAAYLASRRADPDWRGCNVTMPHKQRILPLLDEVAGELRAVNCVLPRSGRLVGISTDEEGIYEATRHWEVCPTGAPVCLLGAGGAAMALVESLDALCYVNFHLVVRDPGKGAAFLDSCAAGGKVFAFEEAVVAMRGATAVVNATPLGMAGFPAMPETVLEGLCGIARDRYALDMVTSPANTAFVKRARALGFTVTDGPVMLVGQARQAFAHFFGPRPSRAYDAGLRKRLTQ